MNLLLHPLVILIYDFHGGGSTWKGRKEGGEITGFQKIPYQDLKFPTSNFEHSTFGKIVNMKSKTSAKRTSFGLIYLTLLVVLALLNNESTKLVHAQLEAVGAVLSVVPVTSILATAGLVGVKLAALSRLLKALGYDQAYLANAGGHGTAAAPIGLQTNYAYMFPYVPGLNISVKGESGTNYENLAQHQRDAVYSSTTRKTFPAMGLPGDYENQGKPFRGSETLREIFRDSGVQLRLPTLQQPQQNFNEGFSKGNGNSDSKIDLIGSNNAFNNVQPSATTPIYNPSNENINNINDKNQQPQPKPQLPLQQPNIPQHLIHTTPVFHPPSLSSFSLNNTPIPPKNADDLGWPNNAPANHDVQPANNQPSSSNIRVPAQLVQPPSQANHPQQQQPHSSVPNQSSQNSQVSKLSFDENHLIPQREFFHHKILANLRSTSKKPELAIGQLTFGALNLDGSVPEYKPNGPRNENLISGSLSSGGLTTNIVPLPYLGPPPFHDDFDNNEFMLVNRRKRRNVSNLSGREAPNTSLAEKIYAASGHQPTGIPNDTFGMPAVNINSLRRRRRSLAIKILSASNFPSQLW